MGIYEYQITRQVTYVVDITDLKIGDIDDEGKSELFEELFKDQVQETAIYMYHTDQWTIGMAWLYWDEDEKLFKSEPACAGGGSGAGGVFSLVYINPDLIIGSCRWVLSIKQG